MKNILVIVIFFISTCGFLVNSAPIERFSAKYPYNLLTPGHNIVTEDDLAFDNQRREIGPYNPKDSLSGLYWQCFSIEDVEAGFDAWVGPDGMDRHDAVHTMCTIEISVHAGKEVQVFGDRRGHQIEFCLDFVNAWKKLTARQSIVCINGEGGQYYPVPELVKQKLWTWIKFKTKRGCYSYFAGDCKTLGCGDGKGECQK